MQYSVGHENHADMYQVRGMFDDLIKLNRLSSQYLSSDADIVHSKDFENAVVKVLGEQENRLTPTEKRAIKRFLITETNNDESDESDADQPTLSFAERSRQSSLEKKRKRATESKYRPMNHVSPTTCLVERLFSRAKLIMTDHRKSMSSYHLELILCLLFHRQWWSAATIDEIINNKEYLENENDEREVDSDDNFKIKYCKLIRNKVLVNPILL